MVTLEKALNYGLPCPDEENCGSSDAATNYPSYIKCYSCGGFFPKNNGSSFVTVTEKPKAPDLEGAVYNAISSRNIKEETCKKYGVTVKFGTDGKISQVNFPFYSKDNLPTCNKARKTDSETKKKYFDITGSDWNKTLLFGQQLFPSGSAKYVTITEGELDALAAYQTLGNFPVVSIRNGAQSAVNDCKRQLEWLESYERVYIMFDNDKEGQKAAKAVADLLEPGKAHIVHLPNVDEDGETYKDACDFVQKNKGDLLKKSWWKAEKYTPSGLVFSSSLRQRIKDKKKVENFEFPWKGLNKTTYGLRKGETILFFAPPKVGKTQVLREIKYHLFNTYPNEKIGDISLEETPDTTAEGLMSLHAGKAFHLPDTIYTDEEWDEAFEYMLAPDRFVFYDAFATKDFEAVQARIRFLAKGLDCGFVFLDNVSVLIAKSEKDERKELDRMASTLSSLAKELNICLVLVAHENRTGTVRGSAGFEQFCNMVVQLSRDKKAADPEVRNTTTVFVTENRFNGETGPACYLKYDSETTRMTEFDPEFDPELVEEEETDRLLKDETL